MEAEITALAHCCRDLFPIININQSLGKEVVLPFGIPSMKVSVNEDNAGAPIHQHLRLVVSIIQTR